MYLGIKRNGKEIQQTIKILEKCHVLLVYESMIPSVHLCGDGQLGELDQMGRIAYRKQAALSTTRGNIEWADVIVLCRLDTRFGCELAKRFHDAQKYVIYMLDDDLLEIPEHLSVSAYYDREDTRRHIRTMLDISDALLSTSPKILEKYRHKGADTYLVDGFADDFPEFTPHMGCDSVKIGFAGSLDRGSDVNAILGEVLECVKRKYGNRVQFEFVGVKPDCAEKIHANVMPYMDSYKQYRETIASLEWDIGLAPMPDTEFHSCKYINKYIEYASIGATGIFSCVEPYSRLREEMGIGALCENTSEAWFEALCMMIEDNNRRERARRAAYEYVRQEMNLHAVSERFFEELRKAFEYRAPKTVWKYGLGWQKTKYFVSKGWGVVRKYRLKLPAVIWQKLRKRS